MQGQRPGGGKQHEVLHDVLALHAQPQRVAVDEGDVGPHQQHEERARQLKRGRAEKDRHPPADQEPGAERDLERANEWHR